MCGSSFDVCVCGFGGTGVRINVRVLVSVHRGMCRVIGSIRDQVSVLVRVGRCIDNVSVRVRVRVRVRVTPS
mgnify:CR=1 FL=1